MATTITAGHYAGSCLLIAAEYEPCTPVAYDNCIAINVTDVSFPALYRQKVENAALHSHRGSLAGFNGAQAELSFSFTSLAPADIASLKPILWAAGIDDDGSVFANNAAGRTLQLVRYDRDGLMLESLSGCIISSIAFNFSTDGSPLSLTVNGTAAKMERLMDAFQALEGTTISSGSGSISLGTNAYMSTDKLFGVSLSEGNASSVFYNGDFPLVIECTSGTLINAYLNIEDDDIILDFNPPAGEQTIKAVTLTRPDLATAYAAGLPVITVASNGVTECTATFETGMSFGSLVDGSYYPTVYQCGGWSLTGSVTAVITPDFVRNNSNVHIGQGPIDIIMSSIEWQDSPAVSLDPAQLATASYSFKALGTAIRFYNE